MTTRPTQCAPDRRSRRDGRIVSSIGAFALALASGSAAGTAPVGGEAPPVTDVAFHDGVDVPIQALAFFPVVVLSADRAPPEAVRGLARAGSHPVARLAAQPRNAPDDLLARARRLAVAGYEGALLEIPPGRAPPQGGRRAPSPRRSRRCAPSGRKGPCCWPPIRRSPSRLHRSFRVWSSAGRSPAPPSSRHSRAGSCRPGARRRSPSSTSNRCQPVGGPKRAGSPSRLRARDWCPG